MSRPYKIAIAGIGGIGGYYGGLLADANNASSDIHINFVARGNHMLAIKQKGLQLNRNAGNIIAHPHYITDNPAELGKLDLIIFCCKAYDLQNLAASFSGSITEDTLILPLLNGVDSTEILQSMYPHAKVLYGCTYLFAKIASEGVVNITGDLNQLLFGNPGVGRKGLEKLEAIFKATGVNVAVHDDIRQKIWEKFSFISPMATATSAFNSSVDVILADSNKRNVLNSLMHEIVALSKLEGIALPDNIVDINMSKLEKLPAGATSSMHNDYKNNKNTELRTLTGYVVNQALKYNLDVPTYADLYSLLKSKTNS
jgi:2-dehydropantoate 2-reductase